MLSQTARAAGMPKHEGTQCGALVSQHDQCTHQSAPLQPSLTLKKLAPEPVVVVAMGGVAVHQLQQARASHDVASLPTGKQPNLTPGSSAHRVTMYGQCLAPTDSPTGTRAVKRRSQVAAQPPKTVTTSKLNAVRHTLMVTPPPPS